MCQIRTKLLETVNSLDQSIHVKSLLLLLSAFLLTEVHLISIRVCPYFHQANSTVKIVNYHFKLDQHCRQLNLIYWLAFI